MSVEMVEGAWYRRRDGEVTGPVQPIALDSPFEWEIGGTTYTDEGRYWDDGDESPFDLVERVNPDGTPHVEPASERPQPEQPESMVDTSGEDWVDARTVPKDGEVLFVPESRWSACEGPYLVELNNGHVAIVDIDLRSFQRLCKLRWSHRFIGETIERGRVNLKTGQFVANEPVQEPPQPEQPKRLPQVGELVEEAQPDPPPTDSIEARQFGDEVEEIVEELEVVARWRSGSVEVSIEDGEMSHRVIGRQATVGDAATLSRLYDRAARRWSIISKQLREGGK